MTNPILSDELVEVVARKIHETFWLCQYGDEVGTAKSVALSTWESSKLMRMAEASAAIPLIQAGGFEMGYAKGLEDAAATVERRMLPEDSGSRVLSKNEVLFMTALIRALKQKDKTGG